MNYFMIHFSWGFGHEANLKLKFSSLEGCEWHCILGDNGHRGNACIFLYWFLFKAGLLRGLCIFSKAHFGYFGKCEKQAFMFLVLLSQNRYLFHFFLLSFTTLSFISFDPLRFILLFCPVFQSHISSPFLSPSKLKEHFTLSQFTFSPLG